MAMGLEMGGYFTVTPAIPQELITGTRYDAEPSENEGESALVVNWYGKGESVVEMRSADALYRLDDIRSDLKAILALLGDGYEYSGGLEGQDADLTDQLVGVRIQNGHVISEAGEVVYGLALGITNEDLEQAAGRMLPDSAIERALTLLARRKEKLIAEVLREVDVDTGDEDPDVDAEIDRRELAADDAITAKDREPRS